MIHLSQSLMVQSDSSEEEIQKIHCLSRFENFVDYLHFQLPHSCQDGTSSLYCPHYNKKLQSNIQNIF